jgi:hypothetical protein
VMKLPGQNPLTISGNFSYEVEWGKMEIGQSFFIPTHDGTSVRSQLYWQSRHYGYNLMWKNVRYKGLYGLMVWRLSDDAAPEGADDYNPED